MRGIVCAWHTANAQSLCGAASAGTGKANPAGRGRCGTSQARPVSVTLAATAQSISVFGGTRAR